jgi:hypothetical protein
MQIKLAELQTWEIVRLPNLRPFSKKVIAEAMTDPYQTLTDHITDMRGRMDMVNERLQNAPAVKTAEDKAPEMDLAALFADLAQGIALLEDKLGGDDGAEPELHKGIEELENKLWKLEEACGLTPKLSPEEKEEPEHKEVVEEIEEKKEEVPTEKEADLTDTTLPAPTIQNVQPTDQDNLEVPVVKPSSPPAPGQIWVYNPDVNAYVSMPDPAAPGKTI